MTSYCPSKDWDRYVDEEEKAEVAKFLSDLDEKAFQCFLAMLAGDQSENRPIPNILAQRAFQAAASFKWISDDVASAGGRKYEKGEWASEFWQSLG